MPAAQAVHTREVDAAATPPYAPAPHAVQALETAGRALYLPTLQLAHWLAPVDSVLYLPAIHEVHEFAPTRSEYEPGAQPVQALVPEVNAL